MSIIRRFKTCTYFGAIAVISLLSCLVSYADTTTGNDGGTTGGGTTTEGYAPFSPNANYYADITYDWTDEDGGTHVSNLTEPATEYNQIVAMLRQVYTDPRVPGFKRDRAWATNDFNKREVYENIKSSNTYKTYENKYEDVPYEPCLAEGNPYFSAEEIADWLNKEVKREDKKIKIAEPEEEGVTALMVELVDDYKFDGTVSADEMLKKVKRVTLLTSHRYIDETVSENPGFLFNYVGTLNRFFVITKGNNRIKDGTEGDGFVNGVHQGTRPFYNMFEEFSPTNEGIRYGAYNGMLGLDEEGEGKDTSYAVDHNCASILQQNHVMVMADTEKDARDYVVNFMFFCPDYRFADDNRVKELDEQGEGIYYEWYTYYSKDHMPYFFLTHINAEIRDQPKCEILKDENGNILYEEDEVTKKRKATVALRWESTYNEVVGYKANEDFYIYRVINDVEQPDPISPDEFEINRDKDLFPGYYLDVFEPDQYVVVSEDEDLRSKGCITTNNLKTIAFIKEDWEHFAHDVHYVVKSRRYGTDFELNASQIVTATIPGYIENEEDPELKIVIDGDRNTVHDLTACQNEYVHTIKFVDRKYDATDPKHSLNEEEGFNDCTLRREHIDAPVVEKLKRDASGNILKDGDVLLREPVTDRRAVTTGTQFILKRYSKLNSENRPADSKDIATLEVTRILEDQYNQWEYECKVSYTDNENKKNDISDAVLFKSSIKGNNDGEKNPVIALTGGGGAIPNPNVYYIFEDRYSAETRDGAHPEVYNYYIDYAPAEYAQGPESDFNADSNVITFLIPKNALSVGYVPYTEEEILKDFDHATKLKTNNSGIQFEVTSNPNVATYSIYKIADSKDFGVAGTVDAKAAKTPIVRVTRLSSGRLYIERQNSRGQLNYIESRAQTAASQPDVPTPFGLDPDAVYGIVVTYNNGNTYGNRLAFFEDRPAPEIKLTMYKTPDQPEDKNTFRYAAEIEWKGKYPDFADRSFIHGGYRAWHNHSGHGNNIFQPIFTDYDDVIPTYDQGNEEVMNAMPRRAEAADDPTYIRNVQFFEAHEASESKPVVHSASVRMYSVVPTSRLIGENLPLEDENGKPINYYIVSDATVKKEVTNVNDLPTVLESIEVDNSDAPVEYFTLQGMKISNPEPGTIVIRRQGSDVTKIMVK